MVPDRDDSPKMLRESVSAKELPIGQEVMQAIEKQLAEQQDIIERLGGRISHLTNYKDDAARATDDAPRMYSQHVNTLMAYSDIISANNRNLRSMIDAIEV